jgi:imidazolonepropionase
MSLRIIAGGRSDGDQGLLISGATQVVTMAGGLRAGPSQREPAVLEAGSGPESARGEAPVVACWGDRILAVGSRDAVERAIEAEGLAPGRFGRLDAGGGVVTPGLVDPHTHLIFAGSREGELALRQQGAGYLEILAAGGGILSTVAATRAATDEELAAHGRRWLDEMLSRGVTTVEAKSGYGLDLPTELKLIEVAFQLGREGPVDVLPTYLGAHAVPPEYLKRPDGKDAFVRAILEEQLPGIAAQGRARFCDVFCEEGVFSADDGRRILSAAERLGMAPRLHADELAPSGGAELAAEIGALSADHLAAISTQGIEALAAAAGGPHPVVATLLPATTLFLMSGHYAPARRLIEAGVPVALGTDFNPGTSPTPNLPLAMTLGCLELKLTPAEALAAVTVNAAHAVGLGDEIGSIEAGKQADLVVWSVPSLTQIPYWLGADLASAIVKKGKVVYERPRADGLVDLRLGPR